MERESVVDVVANRDENVDDLDARRADATEIRPISQSGQSGSAQKRRDNRYVSPTIGPHQCALLACNLPKHGLWP